MLGFLGWDGILVSQSLGVAEWPKDFPSWM
jgi:hypothetical protein